MYILSLAHTNSHNNNPHNNNPHNHLSQQSPQPHPTFFDFLMSNSDLDDFDFEDDVLDLREPKRSNPTKRARAWIWARWSGFREKNAASSAFTDDGKLTLRQMKAFINQMAKSSSRGVSANTLQHYSVLLNRSHLIKLSQSLSSGEMKEVRNFCYNEIPRRHKLSVPVTEKPLASHEDLKSLLHYLWVTDKYVYYAERSRIQLSLLMKIMMYTAARPGAVLVSTAYQDTNQALLYADAKIHLLRNPNDPDGTPLMTLTFQFNYLKGQREHANSFIRITVRQDREFPAECPINDFLALADADNAWEHFESSAEIHEYRLPDSLDDFEVTFKESMCNIPFLRKLDEHKQLSKTLAWTCAGFAKSLSLLGKRAGFKNMIRPYDLRRGASNVLQMVATESELSQHMGHKGGGVFVRSYLSRHIRLDLQGLVNKRMLELDFISQLRSLGLGRSHNTQIPPCPAEKLSEIEQDDDFIKLEEERYAKLEITNRLGMILTRYAINSPGCHAKTIKNLKESGKSEETLEAVKELHQASWASTLYSERWRRCQKEKWRTNWFEEQHAVNSSYVPSMEEIKLVSQAKPGPREPLLVLLYSEQALGTQQLVLLSQKLHVLCLSRGGENSECDDEECTSQEETKVVKRRTRKVRRRLVRGTRPSPDIVDAMES